jgi:hypothetical protein
MSSLLKLRARTVVVLVGESDEIGSGIAEIGSGIAIEGEN